MRNDQHLEEYLIEEEVESEQLRNDHRANQKRAGVARAQESDDQYQQLLESDSVADSQGAGGIKDFSP